MDVNSVIKKVLSSPQKVDDEGLLPEWNRRISIN
jgi:hypothetical protein